MTTPTPDVDPALVELVWRHFPAYIENVDGPYIECHCPDAPLFHDKPIVEHAAHLAAVLEPHIQQRVRDALKDAVRDLRLIAADRMDAHGPLDQRGAAIWDTAAWLDKAKP